MRRNKQALASCACCCSSPTSASSLSTTSVLTIGVEFGARMTTIELQIWDTVRMPPFLSALCCYFPSFVGSSSRLLTPCLHCRGEEIEHRCHHKEGKHSAPTTCSTKCLQGSALLSIKPSSNRTSSYVKYRNTCGTKIITKRLSCDLLTNCRTINEGNPAQVTR